MSEQNTEGALLGVLLDNGDGTVRSPTCCGKTMADDGGCSAIAEVAKLRAERDMWTETARLHLNAEQAFLSWLREAGEHMRAEGVTVCDDGVDSGDILAAKVAECAALLKADRDTLAAELAAANAREAGLRQAVTKYHLALDSRENGNTAGYRLQDEVQRILDMPWRQGAALAQPSTEGGE